MSIFGSTSLTVECPRCHAMLPVGFSASGVTLADGDGLGAVRVVIDPHVGAHICGPCGGGEPVPVVRAA